MGDLIDDHEEFLADSLENEEYFGSPIILQNDFPTPTITHNLTGQVNIVAMHLAGDGEGVTGQRSNCTVRASSLATAAGYPAAGWEDNLPVKGWIATVEKGPLKILTKYVMDEGSNFPDDHIGLITYFLTELKVT